jgi:hypothetical protein
MTWLRVARPGRVSLTAANAAAAATGTSPTGRTVPSGANAALQRRKLPGPYWRWPARSRDALIDAAPDAAVEDATVRAGIIMVVGFLLLRGLKRNGLRAQLAMNPGAVRPAFAKASAPG